MSQKLNILGRIKVLHDTLLVCCEGNDVVILCGIFDSKRIGRILEAELVINILFIYCSVEVAWPLCDIQQNIDTAANRPSANIHH